MLNKLRILITSLLSYIFFSILFIILGIPLLLILLITPSRYRNSNVLIYVLLAALYRGFIYSSGISYEVITSDAPPPFPALYIANHQSAADIVIMGYLQKTHPHFWFYWDHFSTTPVLGWYVSRLGLGITQTDRRRDARTLLQGIHLLKGGFGNAIIFPEGGRFNDGRVHNFVSGFAVIARKSSLPVIPVFIRGMGRAYPPKSFLIFPEKVTIYRGPPFTRADEESDEDFVARIKAWFDNYNTV